MSILNQAEELRQKDAILLSLITKRAEFCRASNGREYFYLEPKKFDYADTIRRLLARNGITNIRKHYSRINGFGWGRVWVYRIPRDKLDSLAIRFLRDVQSAGANYVDVMKSGQSVEDFIVDVMKPKTELPNLPQAKRDFYMQILHDVSGMTEKNARWKNNETIWFYYPVSAEYSDVVSYLFRRLINVDMTSSKTSANIYHRYGKPVYVKWYSLSEQQQNIIEQIAQLPDTNDDDKVKSNVWAVRQEMPRRMARMFGRIK